MKETKKESSRVYFHTFLLLVVVTGVAFAMIAMPVAAQSGTTIPGASLVDDIFFEIEGNQSAGNIINFPGWPNTQGGWDWRENDGGTPDIYWDCNPDYDGFGVIKASSLDCYDYTYGSCGWDAGRGILIQDGVKKGEDIGMPELDTFTSGSQFHDAAGWVIQDKDVGSLQTELSNVYAYAVYPGDLIYVPNETNPCTNAPSVHPAEDTWIVLAMERVDETGTFWMDFELNQVPWTDLSRGPYRTNGDIAVGFSLQEGGGQDDPKLDVLLLIYNDTGAPNQCSVNPDGWVDVGTDPCPEYGYGWYFLYWNSSESFSEYGYAIMNDFSIREPPWGSLEYKGSAPVSRDYIQPLRFAEAAINLSALGIYPECPGFGSIHANTRTSDAGNPPGPTAALSDLAGPAYFPVQCFIEGQKWHDLNASGTWNDPPELPLSDWLIELYEVGNPTAIQTTYTCGGTEVPDCEGRENGTYWFDALSDGDYYVMEVCPEDWDQSYPTPIDVCGSGTHTLTIDFDTTRYHTGINFGDSQNATKSG